LANSTWVVGPPQTAHRTCTSMANMRDKEGRRTRGQSVRSGKTLDCDLRRFPRSHHPIITWPRFDLISENLNQLTQDKRVCGEHKYPMQFEVLLEVLNCSYMHSVLTDLWIIVCTTTPASDILSQIGNKVQNAWIRILEFPQVHRLIYRSRE
jgi:hypothetical protein